MARNPETLGTCNYCGEVVPKRGIDKHLVTCQKRQTALQASTQNPETLWRLRAQGSYNHDYWLELEMRGSATLEDIDNYLRAIWLECCGHLSRFSYGGWQSDELDMDCDADLVFEPGMVLCHQYDFGTTSETDIKVLRVSQGKPVTNYPLSLLARNQLVAVTCHEYDQKASRICMECSNDYGDGFYLCEEHAKEGHDHGYGEPIELVNSPRLGMCGYEGPAEPPY